MRPAVPISIAAVFVGSVATGAVFLPSKADRPPVPPLVGRAQRLVAEARTIFAWVMVPRPRDRTRDIVEVPVRIDLVGDRVVLDGNGLGFRYLAADGQVTLHNATIRTKRPPVRLTWAEPMFAGLLAELDAGLVDTTWAAETPPAPPGSQLGASRYHDVQWYRLDFHGEWDAGIRTFVALRDTDDRCLFDHVVVFERDVDEIVRVKHAVGPDGLYELSFSLCDNVHWDPDFATTDQDSGDPFGSGRYRWRGLDRFEYGPYYPGGPTLEDAGY